MLAIINVSIFSFLIILFFLTINTYFVKKESRQLIREELKNLFDICKKFFVSIKALIEVIADNSLSKNQKEIKPIDKNTSKQNEQTLNLVQTIKENDATSLEVNIKEDDDIALSSFSPEVVEIIREEEEKIA